MNPNRDLHAALQRLNREAHAAEAAARLAGETGLAHGLRNIVFWTDAHLSEAAPGVEA